MHLSLIVMNRNGTGVGMTKAEQLDAVRKYLARYVSIPTAHLRNGMIGVGGEVSNVHPVRSEGKYHLEWRDSFGRRNWGRIGGYVDVTVTSAAAVRGSVLIDDGIEVEGYDVETYATALVDNEDAPCPFCQTEGHDVACSVYGIVYDNGVALYRNLDCCVSCVPTIIAERMDPTADVRVEISASAGVVNDRMADQDADSLPVVVVDPQAESRTAVEMLNDVLDRIEDTDSDTLMCGPDCTHVHSDAR